MKTYILLPLLLLLPLFVMAQTSRYPSRTESLFIQAHFNGNRFKTEGSDGVGGTGFGVKAGYGFSRLFTLYLGIDGANMNTDRFSDNYGSEEFALGYVELGGQFNFYTSKPAAIPYVDVALSGIATRFDYPDDDIIFSGGESPWVADSNTFYLLL